MEIAAPAASAMLPLMSLGPELLRAHVSDDEMENYPPPVCPSNCLYNVSARTSTMERRFVSLHILHRVFEAKFSCVVDIDGASACDRDVRSLPRAMGFRN